MSATQVPTDQLTLTLLGPPGWRRDADAQAPLSRLDAAMLALLVLDGEQPRDRLAAWLWPKVSQRGANLNLRQRIFRLRRDTGHRLIDAGQVLRLTAGVQSDLDADGEWPVEGKLLGGFDFGDCEALDEWMTSARLRCLTRQLDRLAGQASRPEAQGALAAAIATCDRLLARAPLHEHGWRRLMRLHFLRGDRASAIEAFERFETLVRTEQGSRPSPETIALLHEIERMDAAPPDAAGSAVRLLPSLLRPPQLVGRQGALQALTLAGHAGRAALVIAPAGFGKSRLIADFLQGCPGALTSSGQPGDAAMPYALAARLLRAVLERFTPSLQDGVRVELSRLLPELAEAPGGVGQQRLLWQAVFTALVGARANGLAAVAVDDLQFADAASLELLRWLIASAALSDLHFVFATRPEERGDAAPAWRAWLDDSVRIEPVVLGPWTEAEVLALLRSLSLPGLSPLDLAGALHRHAGGHPFLTLETLKHLVLNGGGGGATLPQPAAAQSMIQRRFAGLSAPAVELLHLAAVAGGGLHPQWAAQVLQRRLMQLAAPWAELEAAQILQGSGFAHDLVRQAALAEVPTPVRQALHRALAESCADLQPLAPVLVARHWLGAEDWAAAVPWLRMGARAARTAGRLAEQQALLEQAVDACQRAGDPDGAFDAACDALSGITIRLGSEASLARIDELQVLAATAGQRARLAVARSEALFNLARFDDARQAADDALALAPAGSEEQAHAIALQGRALALTGQCGAALVRLEKALAPGPGPDDRPRLLAVRSALAHALSAVGRVGEALHEQTLAAELAEGIGDAGELAQALANLATLAFIAGKTPDAWRHAQDAERRFVAMDSQDALHGVFNRIVLGRAVPTSGASTRPCRRCKRRPWRRVSRWAPSARRSRAPRSPPTGSGSANRAGPSTTCPTACPTDTRRPGWPGGRCEPARPNAPGSTPGLTGRWRAAFCGSTRPCSTSRCCSSSGRAGPPRKPPWPGCVPRRPSAAGSVARPWPEPWRCARSVA